MHTLSGIPFSGSNENPFYFIFPVFLLYITTFEASARLILHPIIGLTP